MQGVQQAKESKYIMLHAPTDKLDQIKALLRVLRIHSSPYLLRAIELRCT